MCLPILKENLGILLLFTNHHFELQNVIVIPTMVIRIPTGNIAA